MSLSKQNLLNEIIARQGYTAMPNELFQVDITPVAFKVWIYLFGQAEGWNPSYKQIQDVCNIGSRNTVKEAITQLQEFKLLTIESGTYTSANIYTLNPISMWQIKTATVSGGGSKTDQGSTETELAPKPMKLLDAKEGGSTKTVLFLEEGLIERKRENFKEEKPSIEQIRRSWEATSLPEAGTLSPQQDRLPLLRELMATLRFHGYAEFQLPRGFSEKATAPWWSKAKKKDQKASMLARSLEDYDRALADLSDFITIIQPQAMPNKAPKKPSDTSNVPIPMGMSVETALSLIDEDENDRVEAEMLALINGVNDDE